MGSWVQNPKIHRNLDIVFCVYYPSVSTVRWDRRQENLRKHEVQLAWCSQHRANNKSVFQLLTYILDLNWGQEVWITNQCLSSLSFILHHCVTPTSPAWPTDCQNCVKFLSWGQVLPCWTLGYIHPCPSFRRRFLEKSPFLGFIASIICWPK